MDVADSTFLPRARSIFRSAAATDATIQDTVAAIRAASQYNLCPHTAAGVYGAQQCADSTQDVICMATAHPGVAASCRYDTQQLCALLTVRWVFFRQVW